MPEVANSLVAIVEDAARDALERMFFLVVLAKSCDPAMPADGVTAQLTFIGEASGVFTLSLSQETAAEATANFLGEDPAAIRGEQINAVVCEMANIVCGSALSRWRDEGLFSLGQPRIVIGDAEYPRNAEVSAFDMEYGRLTFSLAIEEDGVQGCKV